MYGSFLEHEEKLIKSGGEGKALDMEVLYIRIMFVSLELNSNL